MLAAVSNGPLPSIHNEPTPPRTKYGMVKA
jgi:hypothetical protein